jgi:hypothetical protein
MAYKDTSIYLVQLRRRVDFMGTRYKPAHENRFTGKFLKKIIAEHGDGVIASAEETNG